MTPKSEEDCHNSPVAVAPLIPQGKALAPAAGLHPRYPPGHAGGQENGSLRTAGTRQAWPRPPSTLSIPVGSFPDCSGPPPGQGGGSSAVWGLRETPLSAGNTHRKSGREGPIPVPIYTGRSIKSRPSSPGRSLPAPSRCPACTAPTEAPGDGPAGGRRGSLGAAGEGQGPPRPRRRRRRPWPSRGARAAPEPSTGGARGAPTAQKSSCHQCLGHDGAPSSRRRVCALGAPRGPVSESFAQRVYQPYLTTCDGPRVCSTYRTIYRTAYRRSPGPTPARPRYACCPGWKRTGGLPAACGAAVCQPPCQNGGSCVLPGRCHCPAGWRGDTCQTDVDGQGAAGGGCPHRCASTAGGGWCRCPEGHGPSAGGKLSPPRRGPPGVPPNPDKGVASVVEEEVQRLRSRVDVLEQKLQLVLAPLHSLAARALEQGLPDPGSLLAHSLRQLDRIDSLSEQVSFLEEQLGSCSCKKEL